MIRKLTSLLRYLTHRRPHISKPTSVLETHLLKLQDEIRNDFRWRCLGKEIENAFEILGLRYNAIIREIHDSPELGEQIAFIAKMGEEAVELGDLLHQLKESMNKEFYNQKRMQLLETVNTLICKLEEIQRALVDRELGQSRGVFDTSDTLPSVERPQ